MTRTVQLSHFFFTGAAVMAVFLAGCSSGGGASISPSRNSGQAGPQTLLAGSEWGDHGFVVKSKTFEDGGRIPQSMVYNGVAGSTCTGGDKSPQLSWYHAPREARSFTVLMFDVTASFTHWGMYNIPASTTNLPENAGVAGSSYGSQILNDFSDQHYDGPCPPPGLVHHYIITVFALDDTLDLPSPLGTYPPFPETLLYGLLQGRDHILATAQITGLYST
jgi:Raf kinase inhibitor-like YbhB/YbcL family protein